jgi:lysozyme
MADPVPIYPYYVFGGDSSVWEDINSTPQRPDFQQAYNRGWKFCFHRASFGMVKDSDFDVNWANSRNTPLLLGGYHFLIWTQSPEAQAEFFWSITKNDPGELPLIVDFEWWGTIPSNAYDLLYRFVEKLKTLCGGRRIGIYTAYSFWKQYGKTDPYWKQYVLWLARYEQTPPIGPTMVPAPWTEADFWQFTGHGDGLYYGMESRDVDLDYYLGTWDELLDLCEIGSSSSASPSPSPSPSYTNGDAMYENNALIVAFEKTANNPEAKSIDFARLKSLGVHAVILRCGTSSDQLNYDQPDAGYINDADYGKWLRDAQAAGLRVLIDYDFNAMLDSVNAYDGSVTLRHINQVLSGGLKPSSGGGILLNMERNTWYESGKLVTCVANMYAKDLENVFNQMWPTHRLVPGARTGKWFIDKKDSTGEKYQNQIIFLDKGEANVPLFMARIKKNGVVVNTDFHSVVADLQDPLVTQATALDGVTVVNEQAYYLYYGNQTKWKGWECAWIKCDAVKDSVGNNALFRLVLWDGTPAQFDEYFNFPPVTTSEPSSSASPSPSPSASAPIPPGTTEQKFSAIKTSALQIAQILNDLASKL